MRVRRITDVARRVVRARTPIAEHPARNAGSRGTLDDELDALLMQHEVDDLRRRRDRVVGENP